MKLETSKGVSLMDPRPSRRDKLLSISPDQLLLIARYKLSNYIDLNVEILKSAAVRGNEECAWFLENDFTENSARAQYYQGLKTYCFDSVIGVKLLRKSAKNGFVPAMSELGQVLNYNDEEERVAWIRKAASLNDANGLYLLSTLVASMDFDLLYSAAIQGIPLAIWNLISVFRDRLSLTEVMVFCARYVLISGSDSYLGPVIENVIESGNVGMMYVAGRELEGYSVIWNNEKTPKEVWLQCIEVYLDEMHRARRAALQTTFGLRRILGRDVAGMIGKMIYERSKGAL